MVQNGDLVITSKRLQMVEGLDQKMQRTRGSLLVAKGELFYNGNIGLDYTEVLDVKEKNIPVEQKRLAIMEAITKDFNVEKVDNIIIESVDSNRQQQISLQLKYKDEDETTAIGGVTVG